jgi:hypothetical protein
MDGAGVVLARRTGVEIEVSPSAIKDRDGKVVETIG